MRRSDLLPVRRVAERLELTPRRVYQLIEDDELRAVRLSPRKTRVPRSEVSNYLAKQQATI